MVERYQHMRTVVVVDRSNPVTLRVERAPKLSTSQDLWKQRSAALFYAGVFSPDNPSEAIHSLLQAAMQCLDAQTGRDLLQIERTLQS